MLQKILFFALFSLIFFFPNYSFAIDKTIDFESPGGYTISTNAVSGSDDWQIVNTQAHQGSSSFESQNTKASYHNTTSCFTITENFGSSANVSFYYKVSSEGGYDFLRFYVNDTEKNKWAGNRDWTQANISLPNGNVELKWCYTKDGSVHGGSDKAWVDLISITGIAPPTIESTILNFEIPGGYTVTSNSVSGSDDWLRTTAEKQEGSYSIESQNSGDSYHNKSSCFERQENIPNGSQSIQFYYKVSSESSYDFLRFYIDGTEKNSWSGEVPWTLASYPITGGNHTFRWCYTKDVSVNRGSDKAWVDNFSIFVPDTGAISISQIAPVPTPTNDSTPNYVFQSSAPGTITYGGSCSSATTNASAGNNIITFNTLTDGVYSNCTIKVGNSNVLNVPSFEIDTVKPSINYVFPTNNNYLMPNTDFVLDVSYTDNSSGIDTSTARVIMQKRNGNSWGPDIASTYVTPQSITQTGARYNISQPGFGRYRFRFEIRDNANNRKIVNRNIYLDEPEMNISRDGIDLGSLDPDTLEFSDQEITVTVKTIGAAFDVGLEKTSDFSDGTSIISNWDGNSGVGYDKTPYTGNNQSLSSQPIILSQGRNLNVNGEKNIYTTSIKIGTLVSKLQEAGEYDTNLKFNINLTY